MKELTLWPLSKLIEITKATCLTSNNFSKEDLSIYGFSIDSRTVCRGDLFVAIIGDRDGHDYVIDAFNRYFSAACYWQNLEEKFE